ENQGKKVYVCNGSACLTAGTQSTLQSKLSHHFDAGEIGAMCCLGRCHENHAFHYEGKNYSHSAADRIARINESSSAVYDHYAVGVSGTAILAARYPEPAEYYSIFNNDRSKHPEALPA